MTATKTKIRNCTGNLFVWVQGVSFYVKTTRMDILALFEHVSGKLTMEVEVDGTYFSVEVE